MIKEKIFNVPNALSAYRIVALPFIIFAIIEGDKNLYITLLCINLVTDVLDGFIARTFNLETEFGAKLDSIADFGTYIMAFSGMIILESEYIHLHKMAFQLIIFLYVLPQLYCFLRFKRLPSLHLYSNKILGYIQGIFIFVYFVWGCPDWYFYFMITASCIAYLEELIIVLKIPRLRSNVKSIYFMLKEFKSIQ